MQLADRPLEQAQTSTSSDRAIVEAISDWRHEASSARTVGDALRAHVRSVVALARVIGWACLQQTGEALKSGWALWMLAWIMSPLALNHYMLSSHDAHGFASAALADLGILLQWTPLFAFIALATARSKPAAPVLGLIVIVVGLRMLVGTYGWPVVWSFMVNDDAEWWRRTFHGHDPSTFLTRWSLVVGSLLPTVLIVLGNRIRQDQRRIAIMIGLVVVGAAVTLTMAAVAPYVSAWRPDIAVQHPVLLSLWDGLRALFRARFIWESVALCAWLFLIWRQRRTQTDACRS